jgi:tRNA nucleotidyltransferase (CCA-adding enzyme)
MGYDVQNRKLLDPFNARTDLKNRILRAVDEKKFQEDPLRVLRAVQFSARFDLTLDKNLLNISKSMVQNGLMKELPKERIFQEIKKLLLKSQNISLGLHLLNTLGLFQNYPITSNSITALTRANLFEFKNNKQKLIIMLALWSYTFPIDTYKKFLNTLSDDKNLLNSIVSLVQNKNKISINNFTDFDLYMLAREVKIEDFILFLKAINNLHVDLSNLHVRAKQLNILTKEAPAILGGKDLLALGLQASKNFSIILEKAYLAQISGVFTTHKKGIAYLKKELLS